MCWIPKLKKEKQTRLRMAKLRHTLSGWLAVCMPCFISILFIGLVAVVCAIIVS